VLYGTGIRDNNLLTYYIIQYNI